MLFFGAILTVLCIAVIIMIYHRWMQEQYEEYVRQEFEERYARDLDFRWRNQNIRVHSRLVITDEMNRR